MIRSTTALILLSTLTFAAVADEPKFAKHVVNGQSQFEAAGVLDVNGDGNLDIISGDTGYLGPDFKRTFKTRPVTRTGSYFNCFSSIPMDVNGDGKPDYVTCSYFDRNVGWVENPGSIDKPWTYHEIDLPGNIEAAVAVDLTGDGKPEFLPNSVNVVVYYELEKAGPQPIWKKVDLGTAAAGHGIGTGDVNADGKLDIITPKGWFEATDDHSANGWKWHGEFNLGATGIQILGRDVDGDGLTDLVYGMGHNRDLLWIKQEKNSGGARAWSKPSVIDNTLSSVHTLLWADLDGDGKRDELITGKRVYAHEIEAGDVEASQIAYYTFDRSKKSWQKHPIFAGEPARKDVPKEAAARDALKDFPPGTAGTGLEMTAIDIDGDGDVDLVCPGKSGLYYFENLSKTK